MAYLPLSFENSSNDAEMKTRVRIRVFNFCSPEIKAEVRFTDLKLSGIYLSASLQTLLLFNLIKNHWANFSRTGHKASSDADVQYIKEYLDPMVNGGDMK